MNQESSRVMLRDKLIRLLSNLDLDTALWIEENYDEQYFALKDLFVKRNNPKFFSTLVLLNALVCYQLNSTGETYWWEFSKYFIKRGYEANLVEEMILFLKQSRYNVRLRNQKISRLRAMRQIYIEILNRSQYYAENLIKLRDLLVRRLGARKDSKTIVFSIKMFNYATRIAYSKRFVAPFEIDIPIDNRIKKISIAIGVAEKEANSFWKRIAFRVSIPPLHLDSILWTAINLGRKGIFTGNEKVDELIKFLNELFNKRP